MNETCSNCFHEGRGKCHFTPPATIVKALGLEEHYEIESVDVHPDHGCDLWRQKDGD